MSGAVTIQTNPNYFPVGSSTFNNPTGRIYREGISTLAKYVIKGNGSYLFPWGVMASANFSMNQGGSRTLVMDGPGEVYGGPTGEIEYDEIEFQDRGTFRFEDTALLDLGIHKTFNLGSSEKYRFKIMLDMFNVLNTNTVLDYDSDNVSSTDSLVPIQIVPPRVFRIGGSITF
jgi:hypothetical protein